MSAEQLNKQSKKTKSAQMDFTGKNVWVTGAAQGIGLACAQLFVDLGANVLGLDKSFGSDQQALTSYPFKTQTLDISDAAQVAQVCQQALAEQPRVDVLVNGAGILRLGLTEDLSLEDWHQCLNVNAGGAFNLFQQLVPVFKQQSFGSIVTISSNAAHVPRMQMAAYCASKAALSSLNHCVALELAEYGIRCNIVSPGSSDTPMQRSMWTTPEGRENTIRGFPEQHKLGIPLGKIAVPEEIANTVAFLASDLASHITMQDIVVDGGATLTA